MGHSIFAVTDPVNFCDGQDPRKFEEWGAILQILLRTFFALTYPDKKTNSGTKAAKVLGNFWTGKL